MNFQWTLGDATALNVAWTMLLGACAFHFAAHVVASRYFKLKNHLYFHPVILIINLAAALGLTLFAYEPIGRRLGPTEIIPGLGILTVIYLLIGGYGAFMTIYTVLNTSVRLRICVEIHEQSGGSTAAYSEIISAYSPEKASGERYNRLIMGGYAILDGDRVRLTEKGIRLARFFHLAKSFYRL